MKCLFLGVYMPTEDVGEPKLSHFPYGQTISFKELRVQVNKDINIDSFRKALHRLHEQGIITINSRGHFTREQKFEEYLFVYGSLKKGN